MKSLDEVAGIAEAALDRALAAGAEAAEAYASATETTSVKAVGQYVMPREATGGGVCVLVVVEGRVGISGGNGHSPQKIDRLVATAMQTARATRSSRPFLGLPGSAGAPAPSPIHPGLAALDSGRLADDAKTLTDALRAVRGVTYTGVDLVSRRLRFAIANSTGLRARDQSASEKLILESRVSASSAQRTAMDVWSSRGPISQAFALEEIATATAERARAALDAQPLARPVAEAILLPAAVSQIVSLVAPAASGRIVNAKQSPLSGRLGEAIAAPSITLRDRPTGPNGIRHLRVDHEGVPTQEVTILERGVLRGLLYDHASARAEGRASNGHGQRASVESGVDAAAINLELEPGDRSLEEIIEGAERAVLIDEPMMGGFVANSNTGDFSLVAPFAFLVEDGKIRHALPPTTVAGNAYSALQRTVSVSRERRDTGHGSFVALQVGGVSCAS